MQSIDGVNRGIMIWNKGSKIHNPCLGYTCKAGFQCFNKGPGKRECFDPATGTYSWVRYLTRFAGYMGNAAPQDGSPTASRFDRPTGIISIPEWSNALLVSEESGLLRRVELDGTVSTFAGNTAGSGTSVDGTGTAATFDNPGMFARANDGTVYMTEQCKVRQINVLTGEITTLAGTGGAGGYVDGAAAAVKFNMTKLGENIFSDSAGGIAVAPDQQSVVIADTYNHVLRLVNRGNGTTSTLAGTGTPEPALQTTGGIGTAAYITQPVSLLTENNGIYIGCIEGKSVKHIDMDTRLVSYLSQHFDDSGVYKHKYWDTTLAITSLAVNVRVLYFTQSALGRQHDSISFSDHDLLRKFDTTTLTMKTEAGAFPAIANSNYVCALREGLAEDAQMCQVWGATTVGTTVYYVDKGLGGIGKLWWAHE